MPAQHNPAQHKGAWHCQAQFILVQFNQARHNPARPDPVVPDPVVPVPAGNSAARLYSCAYRGCGASLPRRPWWGQPRRGGLQEQRDCRACRLLRRSSASRPGPSSRRNPTGNGGSALQQREPRRRLNQRRPSPAVELQVKALAVTAARRLPGSRRGRRTQARPSKDSLPSGTWPSAPETSGCWTR